MQNYIAEWASPQLPSPTVLPYLVIILATFVAFSTTRNPPRPRDLILLLVGLYASLASIRMIPLFVLIAVPAHREAPRKLAAQPSHFAPFHPPAPSLNAVILPFGTGLRRRIRIAHVIHRQPEAEASLSPPSRRVSPAPFLPLGAIFNHYDWGGLPESGSSTPPLPSSSTAAPTSMANPAPRFRRCLSIQRLLAAILRHLAYPDRSSCRPTPPSP